MKKFIVLIALLLVTAVSFGATYSDGVYRGNFVDRNGDNLGEVQVNVQFEIENDILKKASIRILSYKGHNFLTDKKLEKQKGQYLAALDHIVGKNIIEAMPELYNAKDIPMAGASVRSGKIRSALQDGLNRGPYRL